MIKYDPKRRSDHHGCRNGDLPGSTSFIFRESTSSGRFNLAAGCCGIRLERLGWILVGCSPFCHCDNCGCPTARPWSPEGRYGGELKAPICALDHKPCTCKFPDATLSSRCARVVMSAWIILGSVSEQAAPVAVAPLGLLPLGGPYELSESAFSGPL